ncbi:PREDICTED: U1 snRNP-associated protein usp106-like isoform X1 [Tarenaya hassleriana]|uniref:U1 snRNP-associated protein usp106-like isoform X1 n=1 Tax=Tarenaya hassleriana TaxID=28532 RepID=UPI00053C1F48|nr:PREDICTED: U1 snRNP-associated protein usp106-like isoform X1 [Tarenaya hassleriana]
MDAMRKQLDVLMGANRNGDVTEVNRKYYDREVCRLYLSGLCPHDLFQLTKMDMGPCPKVHSLQLRKEYEEAKAKGVDNYDRELEDAIDRLIVECDRKIGRALKRLQEEDAKAAIAISVSEVTLTPEILELSKQIKEKMKEADQHDLEGKTDFKIRAVEIIEELRTKRADKQAMLLLDAFNKDRASLPQPVTTQPPASSLPPPDPRTQEMINEKLKKAEDLGEQGMVDEAQKALEEAEALKKLAVRQEPVTDSSKYTAADVRITDQKLRLCDICGAFLSVYDSDRRLADHFGGKLHLGYMLIRDKLAMLQFLQEERNKVRKGQNEDRRSKERSRDRESSRDRDQGDSRDRGRDDDRRSRDRDRYYDREPERDHDRRRSYDSRSRRRSRSRSKERPRDYDRHRRHDRY